MALDIDVDISFCLHEPATASELRDFVQAVEAHSDPVAYEVIVAGVDFRAESAEGRALLADFPQLTLYENPPTTPGGRLNHAMGLAAGRYLAPWSSRVHPLPGCLVKLVEILDEDTETGIVSPRLLDRENHLLPSRRRLPGLAVLLLLHSRLGQTGLGVGRFKHYCHADQPSPQDMAAAEFLPARAILVRREALEEVGNFDEGFNNLYFDADLCRRMRKPGWHCHYLAGAVALETNPQVYRLSAIVDDPPPGHLADATRFLLKKWLKII